MSTPEALIAAAPLYWGETMRFAATVQGNQPAIPAIAIPLRDKNVFECPSDHVEHLEQLIPKIDRVLVIGWRGYEENFLRMLAALPTSVEGALVSRDLTSATDTAGHLAGQLPGSWQPLDVEGFSSIIGRDDLLQPILASRD